MNAPESRIEIPTVPGTPYGGGFYAERIIDCGHLFAIIVAPKAEGEYKPARWNKNLKSIAGAQSYSDGLSNTRAMAKAGSEIAKWALGLRIGGFDDWHIPARDQGEILYRVLKPGTGKNYCNLRDGDNPSSVPPGYPYTPDLPAQTIVPAFQEGGAEAFELGWYWTSTEYAPGPDVAYVQFFYGGNQFFNLKVNLCRARAVRMIKL